MSYVVNQQTEGENIYRIDTNLINESLKVVSINVSLLIYLCLL